MTTNLYLIEQGSVLRQDGQRLIVTQNDEELLAIEAAKVNNIFLFGDLVATAQVLATAQSDKIQLVLLTQGGRLQLQIAPPLLTNSSLRLAQYQVAQDDEAASLAFAKTIVAGKIANRRRFLDRHRRNQPETGFAELVGQLSDALEQVRNVPSFASLLECEGDSTRAYFKGLALACTSDLPFAGRKRRPPPDPVNALLSLGYALVSAELRSALDTLGFDSCISIFHQSRYARPSLVLDLLEEFRVDAVDRLALGLVNRSVLTSRHFGDDPEDQGVCLTPEGMKIFFAAYEEHMESAIPCQEPVGRFTLRQALRFQGERLAQALVAGQPYASFQRQ